MKKLNGFDWTTLILVVIGGLNWLLIGIFGFDLVAKIFGNMSWFTRLIYTIVGLSAVYIAIISGSLERKQD